MRPSNNLENKIPSDTYWPARQICMKVSKRDASNRKIQNQSLKKILHMSKTTLSTGLLMETSIWPAEEWIEYSTLMLIHSIINSNKERISQEIILEQRKKGMPNTLYERAKEIEESIGINIDQTGKMKNQHVIEK